MFKIGTFFPKSKVSMQWGGLHEAQEEDGVANHGRDRESQDGLGPLVFRRGASLTPRAARHDAMVPGKA